jgi:outer membrane lipoprotein-sorting protein
MQKKDWSVSIVAGIILGMLVLVFQTLGVLPNPQSAHAANSAEKALAQTLGSYKTWQTFQGEAKITQYNSDGSPGTDVIHVEITQPMQVFISYIASENKDLLGKKWVSDGEKIYLIDDQNLSYIEGNIPSFAKDTSYIPQSLSEIKRGEVYDHPTEMLVSNPIMEYIYPVWFAQGNTGSTYQLLGEENIAGRPTWKVTLQTKYDYATAWIDQETGIILKYYQEMVDGQAVVNMEFKWLEINKQLDTDNFLFSTKEKYENTTPK